MHDEVMQFVVLWLLVIGSKSSISNSSRSSCGGGTSIEESSY